MKPEMLGWRYSINEKELAKYYLPSEGGGGGDD